MSSRRVTARPKPYNWRKDRRRGNCYYTSEALYHILGGRAAGWKPMRITMVSAGGSVENHWFLKHQDGMILDGSKRQFDAKHWWPKPNYAEAVGSGFLTKRPSRRAAWLIEMLTWQHVLPAAKIPARLGRPA
jgi:hypothetical protein